MNSVCKSNLKADFQRSHLEPRIPACIRPRIPELYKQLNLIFYLVLPILYALPAPLADLSKLHHGYDVSSGSLDA